MIYDFHELLGRGIIASRSNRMEEAVKYLMLAGKIEPRNTRVLLWLAASMESLEQKCEMLERALQIDPNLMPVQALLSRLDGTAKPIERSSDNFIAFTCPGCGGKQRFDPDLSGLVCTYCKRVEYLCPANAAENESHLDIELNKQSTNWAIFNSEFACSACGARLSIPSDQSTTTCPFCDSDQIALQSATPDLIPPTAIIPFQLHADDVVAILKKARFPRGYFDTAQHKPEPGPRLRRSISPSGPLTRASRSVACWNIAFRLRSFRKMTASSLKRTGPKKRVGTNAK